PHRVARLHRPCTAPATPAPAAPLWAPRGRGAAADTPATRRPGAAGPRAAQRGGGRSARDQGHRSQNGTAFSVAPLGESWGWPPRAAAPVAPTVRRSIA